MTIGNSNSSLRSGNRRLRTRMRRRFTSSRTRDWGTEDTTLCPLPHPPTPQATETPSCPKPPVCQTARPPPPGPHTQAPSFSKCPRCVKRMSEIITTQSTWRNPGPCLQAQLIWRTDCPGSGAEYLSSSCRLQNEDNLPWPLQGEAELWQPQTWREPRHGGLRDQILLLRPPTTAYRSVTHGVLVTLSCDPLFQPRTSSCCLQSLCSQRTSVLKQSTDCSNNPNRRLNTDLDALLNQTR